MSFRVGLGFDVHQLREGKRLVIGGIEIPHHKGFVAHSDGDVLIHAICDALLGATNSRDIGYHFPDNSNDFKDIDSKILLAKSLEIITKKGYEIVNIDAVIAMQQPKLKMYIPQMQDALSKVLKISPEDISIKATTTEKLGFEGREEGVSVQCVCLVQKVGV